MSIIINHENSDEIVYFTIMGCISTKNHRKEEEI